jgi:hypothetical protein
MIRSRGPGYPAAEAASATFIGALTEPIREDARAFRSEIETALSDLPDIDRDLCVTVALATWMHKLDLADGLPLPARQVAYLYQVGRMAAEELSPGLRSRLAPILAAMSRITASASFDLDRR